MNTFTRSISKVFKGAAEAFQTFPATIACALAFAIVTMVRIQLDWSQQEPYNFLFNCLHWSFALGAIFSLMAITAAQSRYNTKKAFLLANLLGAGVVIITFILLYQFGAMDPQPTGSRYEVISVLAATRVSVAMLISFLVFIILAGYTRERSDFAHAFFMTHKAFFIALIYGIVITAGLCGVAGAVQALLYHAMSSKVYMYIGTVTSFLAFTIFIGYFPDFRKSVLDRHREIAQKQPRFIEVLFGYIMVPIVLALTVVLLAWAGRTVLSGMQVSFLGLYRIATLYALGGIWLHVMVTHHESGLAKFYRKIYPITALVILAFEAWALIIQLGKTGLKFEEYLFILIWIIAIAAAVLLLILQARAHLKIIVLTCIVAVIAVLPVIGYYALPVTAQVNRLEKLLVSEGMLQGEKIIPAATKPEKAVRESITDAVSYLANAPDAKLPSWFNQSLRESQVFEEKLGFEQTWPEPEEYYGNGSSEYMSTALYLPPKAVDIGEYRWAVNLQPEFAKGQEYVVIDGDKGSYRISWKTNRRDGIPTLKISIDDRIILEQDMSDYVDQISAKYPPGKGEPYQATVDDLSLHLETEEIKIMLVFNNVEINFDPRGDTVNYWLNLNSLYLNEK
ncbi:MAG: hypothetical protein ACOX4P_07040 [Anaerovoracaceae bacterium]|jgi:hypothetical protein